MKFEKIKPGMRLYDRHREKMGSTTMRSLGEWPVDVLEVNVQKRRALIRWNGNAPYWQYACNLEKYSDWSMYDKDVAVIEKGALTGQVVRARKLTKAVREARKGSGK